MTFPLHTNNLILLPYMANTNGWRSRTAAGIDVTTDLAGDRVYEVYVMQRKGVYAVRLMALMRIPL
jgi:hypothetical protein